MGHQRLTARTGRRRRARAASVSVSIAWGIAVLTATLALSPAGLALAQSRPRGGDLVPVEEYATPGLEMEISGILPHPTDDGLYFLAANKRPIYRPSQEPKLPARYRGKLLTVDRHTGAIVRAFDLVGGDYGGLASGQGRLYVSSLDPPEILEVDPDDGRVLRRIPIASPAGGLEFDPARGRLISQHYLRFPHLAEIDPATGATERVLWSDESAMDLTLVDGDLLCTWVSGFDDGAFSELRLLDRETGKVLGRKTLKGLYTSMKALDRRVAGTDGFIAMVKTDPRAGTVKIVRHAYAKGSVDWVRPR